MVLNRDVFLRSVIILVKIEVTQIGPGKKWQENLYYGLSTCLRHLIVTNPFVES